MWTQFPPPSNFHWHGVSTKVRWFQYSDPQGTSNWRGMCKRARWYQNSHPHGTSNWRGTCTRAKWYQNSHLHGTSNRLWNVHECKMISKFPPPWNFKFVLAAAARIFKRRIVKLGGWIPKLGFDCETWSFTVSWSIFRVSQDHCHHLSPDFHNRSSELQYQCQNLCPEFHNLSSEFHNTSFTIAPPEFHNLSSEFHNTSFTISPQSFTIRFESFTISLHSFAVRI